MLSPLQRILVSKSKELLRHLAAGPFRDLDPNPIVAQNGAEAVELAARERPPLVILQADAPGLSGFDVCKRIKAAHPQCKVILVVSERITTTLMQRVASSGCDEILLAPMRAAELYDVVAIQLGLPRHGGRSFRIDVARQTTDGREPVQARIGNLSIDGVRLIVDQAVAVGEILHLTVIFEDEGEPLELQARVLWIQEHGAEIVVAASFEKPAGDTRTRLARLTQWEIVQDTERPRIVIKGDFTEATSLEDLLPHIVGRVDFDMSQVRYMNSLGVREWVRFLEKASAQAYEFHACSIAFVLQAAMVPGMLGRGTVASFFAPYRCEFCEEHEDKLLQSAAILAASLTSPTFTCTSCGGPMLLDDEPERYLSFLEPRRAHREG